MDNKITGGVEQKDNSAFLFGQGGIVCFFNVIIDCFDVGNPVLLSAFSSIFLMIVPHWLSAAPSCRKMHE
jgi:hypothetical protein